MSIKTDLDVVTAKLDADATAITALLNQPPSGPSTANYTLNSGYIVTIDVDGISAVTNGGASIFHKNVQMIKGDWYWGDSIPFGSVHFPVISSKSCVINGNTATVTHRYTGCLDTQVVYTFVVSGDDIIIDATVTNFSTSPIPIPAFSSPFFKWVSVPSNKPYSNGLNIGPSGSRVNASINNWIYPSSNVPFAATYLANAPSAAGPPLNFCTTMEGDQTKKFATLQDGVYQVEGVRYINFFFEEVPAQGSRHFKWSYRFGATSDRQYLLGRYKSVLRAQFPTVAYELDARPMAQFASIDKSYVRPDNPYGYNDANGSPAGIWRRIDILAGCQALVTKLGPPMQQANYRGIVAWQLQGINPRGVQYRPDLNIFPAVTIPNLSTLTNGMHSYGRKFGLQGRPGVVVTPSGWDTDGLYVSGTDIDSNNKTKGTYQWAINNGFDCGFYLDSFINSPSDHSILATIRSVIGTTPIYCEFSTALSLAYSGAYIEMSYNVTTGLYNYPWQFNDLRFLYPETIWWVNFRGTEPPGGEVSRLDYLFQNKLTPLVQDWQVSEVARIGWIQQRVAQYIDANNHWI